MRESRLYGSVRGALSNERPYRDRVARNDVEGDKRALRPQHVLLHLAAEEMEERHRGIVA